MPAVMLPPLANTGLSELFGLNTAGSVIDLIGSLKSSPGSIGPPLAPIC
jgi:hypothetical protein